MSIMNEYKKGECKDILMRINENMRRREVGKIRKERIGKGLWLYRGMSYQKKDFRRQYKIKTYSELEEEFDKKVEMMVKTKRCIL